MRFYHWIFFILILPQLVLAQEFPNDLFLQKGDLFPSKKNVLEKEKTRIYLTIRNNSENDLTGIVRFFDSTENRKLGSDKDFFTIAQRSNDVFVDFIPKTKGLHKISAQIFPWETEGENPDNNSISSEILVESDIDNDGILDSMDEDRDGDRIKNENDFFPENKYEFIDSDNDGIGNNTDLDDDNDGVPDMLEQKKGTNPLLADSDNDGISDNEDLFPNNKNEAFDFDQDGIGNKADLDDDNDGIIDTEDQNSENPAPTIIIDAPEKGKVNENIIFDANHSFDKNGKIKKVEWFFGDEKLTGKKIIKSFPKAGNYKIYAKVFDDQGEWRKKAIFITISPKCTVLQILILLAGITFFLFGLRFQFKWKK